VLPVEPEDELPLVEPEDPLFDSLLFESAGFESAAFDSELPLLLFPSPPFAGASDPPPLRA
jgi:hypothetical protein